MLIVGGKTPANQGKECGSHFYFVWEAEERLARCRSWSAVVDYEQH